MRLTHAGAAVVLLGVAACAGCPVEPPPGDPGDPTPDPAGELVTLSGQVLDEVDVGVEGFSVSAGDADTTTDSSGAWEIEVPSADSYQVDHYNPDGSVRSDVVCLAAPIEHTTRGASSPPWQGSSTLEVRLGGLEDISDLRLSVRLTWLGDDGGVVATVVPWIRPSDYSQDGDEWVVDVEAYDADVWAVSAVEFVGPRAQRAAVASGVRIDSGGTGVATLVLGEEGFTEIGFDGSDPPDSRITFDQTVELGGGVSIGMRLWSGEPGGAPLSVPFWSPDGASAVVSVQLRYGNLGPCSSRSSRRTFADVEPLDVLSLDGVLAPGGVLPDAGSAWGRRPSPLLTGWATDADRTFFSGSVREDATEEWLFWSADLDPACLPAQMRFPALLDDVTGAASGAFSVYQSRGADSASCSASAWWVGL